MDEVNKAGKAKKLRGFEMIKSVLLDEEAWSGRLLLHIGNAATLQHVCAHHALFFVSQRHCVRELRL